MTKCTFFALAIASAISLDLRAAEPDTRCFEMRTYFAAEGKLDALHARFRDHTTGLFEKHGITNLGYWVPLENPDRRLIYFLAYPSRGARETAWKEFTADPEWKQVQAASERDGRLVAKAESIFLHATDFSPEIKPADAAPRIFELRTYTCTPGNLPRLLARFRDHTRTLFAKHGMSNIAYWTLDKDQPAADVTLVYILAHKSKEARDASFDAFRSDAAWTAAKDASEKAAGGSLTVADGVKSVLMNATDYSRIK
jgi:NIPSNAP